MKKNYLNLLIITLIAGAFMMTSCGDDGGTGGGSNAPTDKILEWLEGQADHSDFLEIVKTAKLENLFNTETEYTLILPYNSDLQAEGIFAINLTEQEAADLVNYHVIGKKMAVADFPVDGYISSENAGGPGSRKLSIYSNAEQGVVRLNGTQIEAEKPVTNGAIFPYQGVLTPPNLDEQLANNQYLANYKAMVASETDSKNLFRGTSDFTAFVTRNDEVKKYADARSRTITNLSPSDKRKYLHIGLIDTKAHASEGLVSGSYTTLAGDITLAVSGNSININNRSNVTIKDIIGTNGIMYILDKSLVD